MVIDFSIILLYFVEIYIHRIHVYIKMACVEWQDEMAKIKIKEQKLQKEGKGFFFIFYLKIVWVYDNGNFYKENYVTAPNWGK